MINYNIPEPKLSKNFTIDDIHKIRYWNHERFKNVATKERIEYYEAQAEDLIKRLGLTNITRTKSAYGILKGTGIDSNIERDERERV